jgi:hypothetical protein
MATCFVCEVEASKYRCPSCKTVRYCSVACYKRHKEGCTGPSSTEANGDTRDSKESLLSVSPAACHKRKRDVEAADSEEEEKYKLTDEAYERVVNDPKFKKYFLDKRFQKVVREIDCAPNRRQKLQQHVDNDSHFSSIVDEMLVLLGVAEKTEEGLVISI